MPGKHILETERLLLREFDEGDAAAFFALGSDPAVVRFTGDPGFTDIEHAREILRTRPMADYAKYGFGRWACVDKANAAVIGFAGLKYLDDLGEVDIGYRLLPAFWGRGLATEASRPFLDYGFARLQLQEIIGLVELANVASVRVLEKLGMAFVGMLDYRGSRVAKYVIDAASPGQGGGAQPTG